MMIWFQWQIQVGYVLGRLKSLSHPQTSSRVSFFFIGASAREARQLVTIGEEN